jgi:solute carrier family 25 citrate transporter 1
MSTPQMTPEQKQTQQNAVYRKTFGGMMGGIAEAFCLHPLDTIKTRLQLSGQKVKASNLSAPKNYTGFVDCASQTIKTEGPLALYQGVTVTATSLVCKYFLRFYTNFQIRAMLTGGTRPTTNTENIVAGISAGTIEALIIVTPFEVVKTRLQAQGKVKKYSGPMHCLTTIVKREGPMGLWKGCAPTVFRQASNQGSMFASYSFLRRKLWGDSTETLKPWQSAVTGLFAACVGPMVNGPADVVKTRLMFQTHSMVEPQDRYKGFFDAFKRIVAAEGIGALYKGLGPRLLRLAPGQAIIWMVVEEFNITCNNNKWLM